MVWPKNKKGILNVFPQNTSGSTPEGCVGKHPSGLERQDREAPTLRHSQTRWVAPVKSFHAVLWGVGGMAARCAPQEPRRAGGHSWVSKAESELLCFHSKVGTGWTVLSIQTKGSELRAWGHPEAKQNST